MFYSELMAQIREIKAKTIVLDVQAREMVIKNLIFLYHACVASEELLLEAVVSARTKDGEFLPRLSEYYHRHLREEKGEIELLRADLADNGIETGMPDPFVMAMIGTQYYMIKHLDPVCLLGYLAVQEADPTPVATVELLEKLYGKTLLRFLRLHAVKDLDHAQEIASLIEAAPEEAQGLISFSAANVLDHYAKALITWKEKGHG